MACCKRPFNLRKSDSYLLCKKPVVVFFRFHSSLCDSPVLKFTTGVHVRFGNYGNRFSFAACDWLVSTYDSWIFGTAFVIWFTKPNWANFILSKLIFVVLNIESPKITAIYSIIFLVSFDIAFVHHTCNIDPIISTQIDDCRRGLRNCFHLNTSHRKRL